MKDIFKSPFDLEKSVYSLQQISLSRSVSHTPSVYPPTDLRASGQPVAHGRDLPCNQGEDSAG